MDPRQPVGGKLWAGEQSTLMEKQLSDGGSPSPIGQIVQGRYEIKAALDQGGMGQVFTAWDQTLKRTVVIKLPRRDLMEDPRQRKRFLSEVRDLAAHQHPNILSIENTGEHEGMPFAVLQFLGGGNLRQKIAASGGRQTLDEIRSWLVPVAEALDFIHSKRCLHRDVKPANIVFDEHGHAFLADFGISTALDSFDAAAPTLEPRDQMTVQGGFIGSPAYAPPEAIDRDFTPQYDQYSLATIVYFALAGELPFDGQTASTLLAAKSSQAPRPLHRAQVKGGISSASIRALMKALSPAPSGRFGSCIEFAASVAPEPAGVKSDRNGRTAIAGVLGAVFLLISAYWMWDGRPAGAPSAENERELVEAAPIATFAPAIQLGSTPDQQEAAVALCLEYGGNCTSDQFADETLRSYQLGPIDMDLHEVTNEAFAAWVEREEIKTQAEQRGASRDGPLLVSGLSWREPLRDRLASQHPRDPVVHVSFSEAARFCASSGRRLPTHDEWEFVARGQGQRVFPWGNEWGAGRVRAIGSGGVGLEPVGSHPSGNTPEGHADLAGSVWEWTTDVHNSERITKGGSWDLDQPAYLRGSMIGVVPLDSTSSDLGFRCVKSSQ